MGRAGGEGEERVEERPALLLYGLQRTDQPCPRDIWLVLSIAWPGSKKNKNCELAQNMPIRKDQVIENLTTQPLKRSYFVPKR